MFGRGDGFVGGIENSCAQECVFIVTAEGFSACVLQVLFGGFHGRKGGEGPVGVCTLYSPPAGCFDVGEFVAPHESGGVLVRELSGEIPQVGIQAGGGVD